jgi:site-specific DNA-cytosine methylase
MKNSYVTITDQFCGAGGSSQGARELSRMPGFGGMQIKLALNHWKLAIETHNTNFPDTLHDCTDISACDPRRYPKTNVLITSPECTNHSLANGKKKSKQPDLFTVNLDHSKSDKCFDRSMAEPMRAQTTADCSAIVVPFVVENFGTSKARSLADRLGCLTGQGKYGVVNTPVIDCLPYKIGQVRSLSSMDPIGTQTTTGKFGLLTPDSFKAFLTYYYGGSDQTSKMNEATDTISTKQRLSLVTGPIARPRIEDCSYRMLKPHEVKLAMAFEKDYIVLGNSREQVKQCGNAVTPPAMKFLLERGIATLK